MDKKSVYIVVGVVIIILAIVFIMGGVRQPEPYENPPVIGNINIPNQVVEQQTEQQSQNVEEEEDTGEEMPAPNEVIITITDNGFSPKIAVVPKGTRVVFVNQSDSSAWPASDIHPTHRVYPGSGIEKCGTPEESSIFDACHGLQKGEEYSFVFNEGGKWDYHDHLRPFLIGTIIVEEGK